jgi:DNA-binding NarL/FixJ family response regulator
MKKQAELTDREHQAFTLLVGRGLSNQEIAKKMRVTLRTVKFHMGNLLQKFDCDDRVKLVVAAHKGKAKAVRGW